MLEEMVTFFGAKTIVSLLYPADNRRAAVGALSKQFAHVSPSEKVLGLL